MINTGSKNSTKNHTSVWESSTSYRKGGKEEETPEEEAAEHEEATTEHAN